MGRFFAARADAPGKNRQAEQCPGLDLGHMIAQSHSVTDPIESPMISAVGIQRAFGQASLVDCAALRRYQDDSDASMTSATQRAAFRTGV
ncbi:hypothetical protein ACW9UR_15860 [Halovulum sp. GXIMD14794]